MHEDQVCNGKGDCSDASDETRDVCLNHYCPAYAFRCDYGACVQGKSRCNRILDCLDGSDESEALCGRPPPSRVTTPRPLTDNCEIPAIENGHVKSARTNAIYPPHHMARNGESLIYVCPNATLLGSEFTYCINGSLILDPPRCISKWDPIAVLLIIIAKHPSTSRGLLDPDPGHVVRESDVRK